ncbi:MAG: DUF4221 family protein [Bacteroidota bacterium]
MFRFFILLIVLVSCYPEPIKRSKIDFNDSLTLTSKDKIRFELDKYTGLISEHLQYYHNNSNDSSYLVFLNTNNNSLYFYNLESLRRKVVRFPMEGPKGVGSITGFLVHNVDSIFLLASNQYKINLITNLFRGDLKRQKFSLLTDSVGLNSAKALGFTGNSMIYGQKHLHILGVPDVSPTSSTFFQKAKNYYTLSIEDSSITAKSIYTDNYKNGPWPNQYLMYYWTFNRAINQFIVSPPVSDSILVMRGPNQITKQYAGSQFVSSINPINNGLYDFKTRQEHYYFNPSYFMILHDPYRNVYYRFVEIENTRAIEENDERMVSKVPSIIILSEDFIKIGEVALPPYEYFPIMSFVSPKGLFISKPVLKPSMMGIEEDLLGFDIFELTEK